MIDKIRKELFTYRDSQYAKFNKKLCQDTSKEIIGIRIPVLRKIAKEFVNNGDWENYLTKVIDVYEDKYFEEVIFQGLLIGYAKIDLNKKLKYIKAFIPKIDSWAISDTVIPTFKFKACELEKVWEFTLSYTKSDKEFEIRFAVIMMLNYFLTEEYVDKVIVQLDKIKTDKYYAQMAIAWTLAEIGIKFYSKAMVYLNGENGLDKFTYNKTLQKMIESYRIDDSTKSLLRQMKKK